MRTLSPRCSSTTSPARLSRARSGSWPPGPAAAAEADWLQAAPPALPAPAARPCARSSRISRTAKHSAAWHITAQRSAGRLCQALREGSSRVRMCCSVRAGLPPAHPRAHPPACPPAHPPAHPPTHPPTAVCPVCRDGLKGWRLLHPPILVDVIHHPRHGIPASLGVHPSMHEAARAAASRQR